MRTTADAEPALGSPAAGHGSGAAIGSPARYPCRTVLGVPLAGCTMAELVDTIERWVDEGAHQVAVGLNANGVNLVHTDPGVAQSVANSGVTYADGQSLVWASTALGHPLPGRVANIDMIHPLADRCIERGFSMYFLGSQPGVAEEAARRLRERHPGVVVAGTRHGYFTELEEPEVIRRINESGAQLLFVGLGDPKQHHWITRNQHRLRPNVIFPVGGMLDWLSGKHPRPSDWVIRSGLEWAYRFTREPRRLGPRYLLGNPQFIGRFAAELVRYRRANRAGRRATGHRSSRDAGGPGSSAGGPVGPAAARVPRQSR